MTRSAGPGDEKVGGQSSQRRTANNLAPATAVSEKILDFIAFGLLYEY